MENKKFGSITSWNVQRKKASRTIKDTRKATSKINMSDHSNDIILLFKLDAICNQQLFSYGRYLPASSDDYSGNSIGKKWNSHKPSTIHILQ